MSRREFLGTVAATWLAESSWAQGLPIRARAFRSVTIRVTDVARAEKFYRELFGMPVHSRQAGEVGLSLGRDRQTFYLAATGPERLGITRVGVAVDDLTTDAALSIAQSLGIRPVQDEMGPLTARVLPGASPELLIGDPDGLILHLQHSRSCGAQAAVGRRCAEVAPAVPALLTLRGLNHFTLNVADAERSRTFYRSLLGLVVKLYQGPVPMLGFKDGSEFIGMAGATANGATPGMANIAHVCFLVDDFEPGRVTAQLARMGITSGPTPAGPLSSYVSLRMADRNGAPEGTPELYFLDPEGNYIQLQDASYCGGAGYLGDRCASPPQ